ncbi:MAG TPA: HAMP domain-containing sensor histidine kinase [Thermoleophilia bacterium]|nr:HAMP domain-containing sensor histidine kinase [Thermoleophilia bacterium]
MRTRSLRWRLALTYAGMALLTAVILGGILIAVLANHYTRAEDSYLDASAKLVVADPPPLTTYQDLTWWAQAAALTTQTRVQVYAQDGTLVVDSGSPDELDAEALLDRDDGFGHGGRERDRDGLPNPLGNGLFGTGGGARSDRSLTMDMGNGAYVKLSEGPASGRDALMSAAVAWILAAALAVGLAALAGSLIAARIARPVVALTEASDRMAAGDLGARAPVAGGDEVGRLGESFNGMAARVETTVTSLRRFVADAAHEIGTPLTALQADLELAERKATSADERRLVDRALAQTGRLASLSDNLLQLSRLEAGEPAGERQSTDLAAVALELADGVASRAEQAGVELVLDVAAGPLPVPMGHARLQTVLANLLDNAVKFTPEGGSVTLATRREGAQVVATVADTGVGIPADEQREIFERFHRARNVSAYPGNGLGLAIVKAAVERSGGTVSFASSEAGTTFVVRLPLA